MNYRVVEASFEQSLILVWVVDSGSPDVTIISSQLTAMLQNIIKK